jgi:hypothetical protein
MLEVEKYLEVSEKKMRKMKCITNSFGKRMENFKMIFESLWCAEVHITHLTN